MPSLEESEIKSITLNIMAIENIEPLHIKPRRILFNPKSKLTKVEKIITTNKLNGKRRSCLTQTKIKKIIDNWNKVEDGKMTNTAIAKKLNINRVTVGRQLKKMREEV
ncbi:hypothetical protein [Aurantibacter sp.]|uniref:hypothetical protein n=1 Tax=Aurantibacter sp. TaxID=2807103 RepID=UPI0035C829BD